MAESRQLDFWLGAWEVTSPALGRLGMYRISSILNGSAVLKEWTGADGRSGLGVLFYSHDEGKWRGYDVDENHGRSDLSGGLVNGAMILEYVDRDTAAGARQRYRWPVIKTNELQQVREISTDGGTQWAVEYEFALLRKK